MTEESVLDAENWRLEAKAVINDIKNHVKSAELSEILMSTDTHIYFNVLTKECKKYCIELSALGFRIIGHEFDKNEVDDGAWYETPYGLLNTISPLFQDSFGNELLVKLQELT